MIWIVTEDCFSLSIYSPPSWDLIEESCGRPRACKKVVDEADGLCFLVGCSDRLGVTMHPAQPDH